MLDHRQSRYAQPLLARPQDGGGPKGVLERDSRAIASRLRAAFGIKPGETEPQVWSQGRCFPGECSIDDEGPALETVRSWRVRDTIWTDGSRLDSGRVGAACAWQIREGWTGRRFHLGDNKEVFDAEVFAIYQALRIFEARQQSGEEYTVFDCQPAIWRAM